MINFIRMLAIFGLSIFGLSACVASNSTFQNSSSYGTYQPKTSAFNRVASEKWFLTSMSSGAYQGKRITLNLSSDNRVNGFSGCNQYMTSNVKVNGSQIHFGFITSTKKLCAYGMNNLERRYLTALRNVTSFQRNNSRLMLEGSSGTLVFHKKTRR